MKKLKTIGCWLIVVLILSGCATIPKPPLTFPASKSERNKQLQSFSNWEISGALAIDRGNSHDIAHFSWQQRQNNYAIDLTSILNIGGIRIVGDNRQIALIRSQNNIVRAKTPEQLMRKELGWGLPLTNARYWVFGLPSPTQPAHVAYDNANRLTYLEQQHWQIYYLQYRTFANIELPSKMLLVYPGIKIKLVIKKWLW